ncbi:hypothetical protein MMC28_006522 [Mycoblastus sanguinarius]|nr:hypothetical protein [Mycoblastus sanguinarius]
MDRSRASEKGARYHKPKTWDEVRDLQAALRPSFQMFTRLTNQLAPLTVWDSYAVQWNEAQSMLNRLWPQIHSGYNGNVPRLVRLRAWNGGIAEAYNARLDSNPIEASALRHPTQRLQQPGDNSNSLASMHTAYAIKFYDHITNELQRSDASRQATATAPGNRAQSNLGVDGTQDNSEENWREYLDRLIARNPGEYLAWLSARSYEIFEASKASAMGMTWEYWCSIFAPIHFEQTCHKIIEPHGINYTEGKPAAGPGASDRTKYGPPGARPTLSLDDAMRGREAFRMVGGSSCSTAAQTHYSAFKGKDACMTPALSRAFRTAYRD